MKIGILTLTSRTNLNNGAALQAWALKTTIAKIAPPPENEVFVLPLDQDPKEKAYKKYKTKKGVKNIFRYYISSLIRTIKHNRQIRSANERYLSFENFHLDNNFNGMQRFFPCEIDEKTKDIDVFVIGSDWVWHLSDKDLNCNPKDLSELSSIYLGFSPTLRSTQKRIAYAASQGIIPNKKSSIWKDALKNFSTISVREAESRQYLCQNDPSKQIECVVDPTLLLNVEDLRSIESQRKIYDSTEGFIALYVLPSDNTEAIRKYANRLAKLTGLRICNLSWDREFFISGTPSLGNRFGPSEFLAGIQQSSYLITNSFHGMVFASLYHKPFTAFQRQENDFRQLNLVRLLNLKERLLINNGQNEEDPFGKDVNWKLVDKNRNDAARLSMEFLKRSILDVNSSN